MKSAAPLPAADIVRSADRNGSPARAAPSAMRRAAFLVLGMHRSGTSAVAGLLDHLGVPTPGELLPPRPDNPKGFFENKAVYEFHDRVLAHFGSAWDDPMPVSLAFVDGPAGEGFVDELMGIIRAELLDGTALFAVKDPRMCRFVPLWLRALERLETAPHAVIPLRHPAEVAGSLKARNGFPRAKSYLLWLQHTLSAERGTRGTKRAFVSYERLVADWRGETERMRRDLGVDWPRETGRIEEAVDGFLVPDMRHHRSGEDAGAATELDALTQRAFAALSLLVADGEARGALDELDAVAAELGQACRVLGPYVNWEFTQFEKARLEVDRLAAMEVALRAERAEADTVFRGHLEASEARAREAVDSSEARARHAIAELRHVAETQRRMVARESRQHENWKSRAEEAEQRIGEANEARLGLDRELEIVAAERDGLRRANGALTASTSWRLTQPLRDLSTVLPVSLKRFLRQMARAGYWALTPWKTSKRLDILRQIARRGPDSAPARLAERFGVPAVRGIDLPASERTFDVAYDDWVRLHDTLTTEDRAAILRHIAKMANKPLISIVMPAYNTPEAMLRDTIAAVQAQLYRNWELCIADDASPKPHVQRVLNEAAASDPRIRVVRRETNGHIAHASNSALALATGEFVALLDHDDLLPPHALYEVAALLDAHPDTDIIYSDEDKIDEDGRRYDPYFKTAFNIELMLGQNMISHLGVYRRSLLSQIGGFRPGFEGSQDYDLALRALAISAPERVHHIPAVLYHWRQEGKGRSFSQSNLEQCVAAARRSITEWIEAKAPGASVGPSLWPSYNRVRWPLPDKLPLVSIIIPTRDRADLLRGCVEGLLHRTRYDPIEIIIVDNDSCEEATTQLFAELETDPRVRIIASHDPFNYAALNNMAAREAKGEILLLLNNDIDVIDSDWLGEMVSLLLRPGVGAVGAKLLYEDGRVQHAGVRLGAGRSAFGPGVAGHFGLFRDRMDPGYFGQLLLTREVGAATAACLAVRRETFESVGGLNETDLAVAFNDIDFCLKIRASGQRILWTPYAELHHLESASRGEDLSPEKAARFEAECRYMLDNWGEELANDPFYPESFDDAYRDLVLAFPPSRRKPWTDFLTRGKGNASHSA